MAIGNRDKVNTYDNNRRVAKACGQSVSLDAWRGIIELFNGACAYCLRTDRKLTQDHMTPLSRGGEHAVHNVVPACGPCNSRKNARSIFAMLRR